MAWEIIGWTIIVMYFVFAMVTAAEVTEDEPWPYRISGFILAPFLIPIVFSVALALHAMDDWN